MGRPSKLTSDTHSQIVHLIAEGNFREVASKAAGVSAKTMSLWMKRGAAEEEGPYHDFRKAVLEAETRAEVNAVAAILAAGKADPKHLQWFLERKFPERWGSRNHIIRDLQKAVAEMRATLEARQ